MQIDAALEPMPEFQAATVELLQVYHRKPSAHASWKRACPLTLALRVRRREERSSA